MNEHFNITCEGWQTMFSPKDDHEMVVFDVRVQYTKGDEGPFEEPLWFEKILEWLKEHDLELLKRISKVWGETEDKDPGQPRLIAELEKRGIDMNALAIKITRTFDLEARRQHFLWLLEQVKDLPEKE